MQFNIDALASHSSAKADSFTRAGFTETYARDELVRLSYDPPPRRLTLGSLVSPLKAHSLTPGGASMAQLLACAIQGSLMILTVKPLVALMFLAVSLSLCVLVQAMDMTHGFDETLTAIRWRLVHVQIQI